MAEQEGVIKYQLQFEEKPLAATINITELNHWRTLLREKDLVGQNDQRYGGYGFGNLSLRLDTHSFLITGTQTGELAQLQRKDFAVVTDFNKEENKIVAYGECQPSSEALSHAAIFQASENIKAVFHVHSPDIWHARSQLDVKTTAADIPYGTPQMANAMQQLVHQPSGCITMLGHEDGVISWGQSCQEAGDLLLKLLKCCS